MRVVITPDGRGAYVPDAGSNSVTVINTGTDAVTATTPVGVNPKAAALF